MGRELPSAGAGRNRGAESVGFDPSFAWVIDLIGSGAQGNDIIAAGHTHATVMRLDSRHGLECE